MTMLLESTQREEKDMIRMLSIALLLILPALANAKIAERTYRIAVIDTGVAKTAFLKDSLETEVDMIASREPWSTDVDHGTYMATVLVREAKHPVRILSFRVDDPKTCRKISQCPIMMGPVAAAIRKAVELHVDIVNYSLDTPFDQEVLAALKSARDAGIKIVMSAGNVNQVPRNLEYVLEVGRTAWIVGSVDAKGSITSFSGRPARYCDCNFVWRPGTDIPTQDIHGRDVRQSGASMSVPLMVDELIDIAARARAAEQQLASR